MSGKGSQRKITKKDFTNVRFEKALFEKMKEIAPQYKMSTVGLIEYAARIFIQNHYDEAVVRESNFTDFETKIIQEIRRAENRLVGLVMRNSIDTGMILIDTIEQRSLDQNLGKDKVYQDLKNMAVTYVNRERTNKEGFTS